MINWDIFAIMAPATQARFLSCVDSHTEEGAIMSQAALLIQFAEEQITLADLEEQLDTSVLSDEIASIIADPLTARALAIALCAHRQPTELDSVGGCSVASMLVDGSIYPMFERLHDQDRACFWVSAPAAIATYIESLKGLEADVVRQTFIELAKLRNDYVGFWEDDDNGHERQAWIAAGLFTPEKEAEEDGMVETDLP